MKLSLIMSVYQPQEYERLFGQAINSIFNQVFEDWEMGWELIIMMERGNAEMRKFVNQKIAGRGVSRVKVFSTTDGYSGMAKNIGAVISRAQYLMFVSDHDYFEGKFLETMIKEADASESKMLSSHFLKDDFEKIGRQIVYGGSKMVTGSVGSVLNHRGLLNKKRAPFYLPATIINREFFYEMGGFELGLKGGEDDVFATKSCLAYELLYDQMVPIIELPMYHKCKYNAMEDRAIGKEAALQPLIDNQDEIFNCQDRGILWELLQMKNNLSGLGK